MLSLTHLPVLSLLERGELVNMALLCVCVCVCAAHLHTMLQADDHVWVVLSSWEKQRPTELLLRSDCGSRLWFHFSEGDEEVKSPFKHELVAHKLP